MPSVKPSIPTLENFPKFDWPQLNPREPQILEDSFLPDSVFPKISPNSKNPSVQAYAEYNSTKDWTNSPLELSFKLVEGSFEVKGNSVHVSAGTVIKMSGKTLTFPKGFLLKVSEHLCQGDTLPTIQMDVTLKDTAVFESLKSVLRHDQPYSKWMSGRTLDKRTSDGKTSAGTYWQERDYCVTTKILLMSYITCGQEKMYVTGSSASDYSYAWFSGSDYQNEDYFEKTYKISPHAINWRTGGTASLKKTESQIEFTMVAATQPSSPDADWMKKIETMPSAQTQLRQGNVFAMLQVIDQAYKIK